MNSAEPGPRDSDGALSRRGFLWLASMGGLAAVGLPLGVFQGAGAALAALSIPEVNADISQPSRQSPPREIVPDPLMGYPQIFGLSFGGSPLEIFRFEGGEAAGRSSSGQQGMEGRIFKHIQGFTYRDLVFYYLPVPGQSFNNWLVNSLQGATQAITGSIFMKDRFAEQGNELQFSGGFLRELSFPDADIALPGHSASLRVTIGVMQTQRVSGSYAASQFVKPSMSSTPLKGYFHFSIDGWGGIQQVARVETPIFSAGLLPPNPTVSGFPGTKPQDYSNVKVVLPETQAQPFYDWHANFVIKGLNADRFEKKGTLRWLSPTQNNTVVFMLHLEHLGIVSVVRLPDKPGYVQVEMYCEKVVPEFG